MRRTRDQCAASSPLLSTVDRRPSQRGDNLGLGALGRVVPFGNAKGRRAVGRDMPLECSASSLANKCGARPGTDGYDSAERAHRPAPVSKTALAPPVLLHVVRSFKQRPTFGGQDAAFVAHGFSPWPD